MNYIFSENEFKNTFEVKEDRTSDSLKLTHKQNKHFKLFPYNTSPNDTKTKNNQPIKDLNDIALGFFRKVMNIENKPIDISNLMQELLNTVECGDDQDLFEEIIRNTYFEDNEFIANSLALYPYQTKMKYKDSKALLDFIYDVLDVNEEDNIKIRDVIKKNENNVLESILIDAFHSINKDSESLNRNKYFIVNTKFQEIFKKDLFFMLKAGMTSLEDLVNLFDLYYFNYVSQSSIALDRFCIGKRDDFVPLYFSLSWEKVSTNRLCCTDGWMKLSEKFEHMFSHAITLEIINQQEDLSSMFDYIKIQEYINNHPDEDNRIAEQIEKAENLYVSCIGDCNGLDSIKKENGVSSTDIAIKHLFACVEKQFSGKTSRVAAKNRYNDKFPIYCKERWTKDRKKSHVVLNLTERDIIFLTKLAIEENDKIRLLDLFKEYEYRGVYLDNTSKEYLLDFFTKLNLIDKKSDSGDAQYVKRIL